MEGYRVKEYGMPVKRYCQALDLKNNPELIAEYRKIHSREKAWPEIRAGNAGKQSKIHHSGYGIRYQRRSGYGQCAQTAFT